MMASGSLTHTFTGYLDNILKSRYCERSIRQRVLPLQHERMTNPCGNKIIPREKWVRYKFLIFAEPKGLWNMSGQTFDFRLSHLTGQAPTWCRGPKVSESFWDIFYILCFMYCDISFSEMLFHIQRKRNRTYFIAFTKDHTIYDFSRNTRICSEDGLQAWLGDIAEHCQAWHIWRQVSWL